ncbi:MAG: iron-sulfur cluster assembly scaffold protein [Patescibacteria group bacterium]|jgi:nitrogen fixation NifU-like protein
MALNYTKKTLDNFLKPKNVGKINKPDGYAQIGNMVCGDQLDFFLKVEKGKIKDVKFLSFGCASNIATASVLTEKVKGMTVVAAKKYPWQKVVAELGGLPNQKVHCSVMAVDGLKKAIADYEKSQPVAKKKATVKAKKVAPKKSISKKNLASKKQASKKK